MEFKDLLIVSVLGLVMVIGLLSFVGNFQAENSVSDPITSDSRISYLNQTVISNLSNFEANSRAQLEALGEDKSFILKTTELFFDTLPDIAKSFWNMGIASFNILSVFLQDTLGVSPIMFSGFVAILIIVIIFGVWSWWRAGR